jgi:phage gp16-like protein
MATLQEKNSRAAKIRMIQVAKRQLGLDEDTYRAAIALAVPGKTSSSDCTVGQLDRIIDHLKKKGFKPKKPAGAPPRPERRTLDTSVEASKARAVWLLLVEIGVVRDASEAALNAYVKRQAGVDDLSWVKNMEPVIEGLKAWAARKLPSAIQARMEELVRAGVSLPWASVRELARSQAPKRSPDGFEALLAAWRRITDAWPSVMTRSQ